MFSKTNKMNSCIIFSTVIAIVIMPRILFLIGKFGNTLIMTGNNPPFTKKLLRGAPRIKCLGEFSK